MRNSGLYVYLGYYLMYLLNFCDYYTSVLDSNISRFQAIPTHKRTHRFTVIQDSIPPAPSSLIQCNVIGALTTLAIFVLWFQMKPTTLSVSLAGYLYLRYLLTLIHRISPPDEHRTEHYQTIIKTATTTSGYIIEVEREARRVSLLTKSLFNLQAKVTLFKKWQSLLRLCLVFHLFFVVEEFNFSADYLCPQLSLSKNNF